MELLELTLTTPAENLALDEALLLEAETTPQPGEVLRIWEERQPVVVLGRSSKIAEEVHADECERRGIPILRRPSGGGSVVIGPGCLMYSLVLHYTIRPQLRQIDAAHRFVLEALATSFAGQLAGVAHQGTSDLAVGDSLATKFSGNSLRCRRSHLLYHGTVLYDFPLELISACLKSPPRQPEYRSKREHRSFVCNLPMTRDQICRSLGDAFHARTVARQWPRQRVRSLVADRYSQATWNLEGRRGAGPDQSVGER